MDRLASLLRLFIIAKIKQHHKKLLRWTLLVSTIFFSQHAVRDYLQLKGVHNFFTDFAHIRDTSIDEKTSMTLSIILAILSFSLFLLSRRRTRGQSR